MLNLFKVKNKETIATPLTPFLPIDFPYCSGVSIVDFDQSKCRLVNVIPLDNNLFKISNKVSSRGGLVLVWSVQRGIQIPFLKRFTSEICCRFGAVRFFSAASNLPCSSYYPSCITYTLSLRNLVSNLETLRFLGECITNCAIQAIRTIE